MTKSASRRFSGPLLTHHLDVMEQRADHMGSPERIGSKRSELLMLLMGSEGQVTAIKQVVGLSPSDRYQSRVLLLCLH